MRLLPSVRCWIRDLTSRVTLSCRALRAINRQVLAPTLLLAAVGAAETRADDKAPAVSVSGIYPHLAMFNDDGECGTGAVVPWADRLWVVTYPPHRPTGSSDKLYEITPDLQQIVRPESVGGTHANRMIHRESQQLFIGAYAVDTKRNVRAIPSSKMFGRLTGNARHLTEPADKIYFATMEEGLYDVDVQTLAVTELWADEQRKQGRHADLPGYHGKGLFSGQGRIIYANNGDHAREALSNPRVPSGVLAEWDGTAPNWIITRRNQFTEVTGPGGLIGNEKPATDPIWSLGWDHRSLILMLLDGGRWHSFRLPKGSHSYDGAHGWNTEWPRIRDVGEQDLLMTMHGLFWKFPRTFSVTNTSGIRPRSAYLKVVGDFCRWNDQLVLGCDDTAKSEFLNKRKVKGEIEGPGQSQSNLWFVSPDTPDRLGPAYVSGAVWLRDSVTSGEVSDPFLFTGWRRKSAHLVNGGQTPATFTLEVNASGQDTWTPLRDVTVAAGEAAWLEFSEEERGEWIRVKANSDCAAASVHFTFSNADTRNTQPDAMFAGLAKVDDAGPTLAGLVRARGENKRTLQLAAVRVENGVAQQVGSYELGADLKLRPMDDPKAQDWLRSKVAIPRDVISIDEASVLVIDDRGRRWRLPKTDAAYDLPTLEGRLRLSREVATERDLFSAHGTFYELPAENADGFAKVRPVATHRLHVMDYCSYRGMLVLAGVCANAAANPHIVRSDDGKAAVWLGTIDDLWKLGKPTGVGGPWQNSAVKAGKPSDAYLLWGYDDRRLTLTHSSTEPVAFRVEVDLTGEGDWVAHKSFTIEPGQSANYAFPASFQARWLRVIADKDCSATAKLTYQ